MAAVVEKVQDGFRYAVFRLVNNDTAETSAPVTKIDLSDPNSISPGPDGQQPTSLRLLRAWYSIGDDPIDLYFGATADQLAWSFMDHGGYLDFRCGGGIAPADLEAAGFTGDLLLQMRGTFAAATDGYSILLEVEKRYE